MNQREKQWNLSVFSHGFACRGTEGGRAKRGLPEFCGGQNRRADAKRRTFTAEYKLRILAEADAAATQSGAIGALQRREGLYSSHLVTWRRERQSGILKGLTPHKRGPKSKRSPIEEENHKLRRENERLTEQLRKAEIVIDVQKKVGALLGWPLPKADSEGKP